MTSLCPDVRWKSPAICPNTDCIAAADSSLMSAAAAGLAFASNAPAKATQVTMRSRLVFAVGGRVATLAGDAGVKIAVASLILRSFAQAARVAGVRAALETEASLRTGRLR